MSVKDKIKVALFSSANPLSLEQISEAIEESSSLVSEAIEQINQDNEWCLVQKTGNSFLLVTNPSFEKISRKTGIIIVDSELTKPSLETLSIIAYRGPLRKSEIEQIRGVHAGIILRNLSIKNLIEMSGDEDDPLVSLSHECLKQLGIKSVNELPAYDQYGNHVDLNKLMQDN